MEVVSVMFCVPPAVVGPAVVSLVASAFSVALVASVLLGASLHARKAVSTKLMKIIFFIVFVFEFLEIMQINSSRNLDLAVAIGFRSLIFLETIYLRIFLLV
jgi:hypothetical protein